MDLLLWGGGAAVLASAAGKVAGLFGSSEPSPSYVLTPPVFDRKRTDRILTLTPLESYSFSRHALFRNHFSSGNGGMDRLLDASIHMAPPRDIDEEDLMRLGHGVAPSAAMVENDFMARLYVTNPPPSQEGQLQAQKRALFADATFHLQHGFDPLSFSDIRLRTEGEGSAWCTGAFNFSKAMEERKRKKEDEMNVADGRTPPGGASLPSPSSMPLAARGLSAFYNFPLFGRHPSAMMMGVDQNRSVRERPSFRRPGALRSFPCVGLRFDENYVVGSGGNLNNRDRDRDRDRVGGGYSIGMHLDPVATWRNMTGVQHEGADGNVRVGAWMAQEGPHIRVAAEGILAPLQRQGSVLDADNNAAVGGDVHPAAAGAGSALPAVGPAALLPPSLASSIPLLMSSKMGVYWSPNRSLNRAKPSYEVGFSVSTEHLSSAAANGAIGAGAGNGNGNGSTTIQEFVASYFQHLVVRRKIHNPLEKAENKQIHNYIDLGMELVYRNELKGGKPVGMVAGGDPSSQSLPPPLVRLAASWQLNKSTLLKARVQQSEATIVAAFKSWWQPSASASFAINHSFDTSRTTFGLCVALENVGEALFAKPEATYKRIIPAHKTRIERELIKDEDY